MDKDEKKIELLKLLYDEWKYRQDGLWKRMIQFTVIVLFISTLPITIGLFNGIALPELPLAFFPVVGIFLSAFFVVFCLAESTRIKSIDRNVKAIEKDIYPPEYQKTTLVSLMNDNKPASRLLTARMAVWVPISLGGFQIAIAILVLYLIATNNLT